MRQPLIIGKGGIEFGGNLYNSLDKINILENTNYQEKKEFQNKQIKQ